MVIRKVMSLVGLGVVWGSLSWSSIRMRVQHALLNHNSIFAFAVFKSVLVKLLSQYLVKIEFFVNSQLLLDLLNGL